MKKDVVLLKKIDHFSVFYGIFKKFFHFNKSGRKGIDQITQTSQIHHEFSSIN